jgi:hypothetical protein
MNSEMYCIDDTYYSEIDEMVESATDGYESIEEIPSDFIIEYYECELRPIFKLDSGLLYELIHDHFEENSSEDGYEWDSVEDLIKKHLNLDAINAADPELWFPEGKTITMSRDKVIEIINKNKWFE